MKTLTLVALLATKAFSKPTILRPDVEDDLEAITYFYI